MSWTRSVCQLKEQKQELMQEAKLMNLCVNILMLASQLADQRMCADGITLTQDMDVGSRVLMYPLKACTRKFQTHSSLLLSTLSVRCLRER
jgi:hypothetical protein